MRQGLRRRPSRDRDRAPECWAVAAAQASPSQGMAPPSPSPARAAAQRRPRRSEPRRPARERAASPSQAQAPAQVWPRAEWAATERGAASLRSAAFATDSANGSAALSDQPLPLRTHMPTHSSVSTRTGCANAYVRLYGVFVHSYRSRRAMSCGVHSDCSASAGSNARGSVGRPIGRSTENVFIHTNPNKNAIDPNAANPISSGRTRDPPPPPAVPPPPPLRLSIHPAD
jgi:hypothetical protein